MKQNVLFLFLISLILIRCENSHKECDDSGTFVESWIVGKYKLESRYIDSQDSLIIENSGKVFIYTNTDSTSFIREGMFQYEIYGEPDCICAGGDDSEFGCQLSQKGDGGITISYSNDSICNDDFFYVQFRSYYYKTELQFGGNCTEIYLEKYLGDN